MQRHLNIPRHVVIERGEPTVGKVERDHIAFFFEGHDAEVLQRIHK